jgi:hypothetical protein
MIISVAQAFSPYPAGRFRTDGPYSGEAFREDILVPALRTGEAVTVHLSGTSGYGSSFLEEAFGGLVRNGYFTADELHKKLKIEAGSSVYEVYKRRVQSYINRAVYNPDQKRA